MSSIIVQTIQKRRQSSLPTTTTTTTTTTDTKATTRLRQRLHINPPSTTAKPISSWWGWAWSWFRSDLDMDDLEKRSSGFQNRGMGRGSFMHVLFNLKSHFTKLFRFHDNMSTLPQSIRYEHHRPRFNKTPIY